MPVKTVATDGFVDVQEACLVTSWFVPFEKVAVAENCEDSPGLATELKLVTVTPVTVDVDGDGPGGEDRLSLPPPQLTRATAQTKAVNRPTTRLLIIVL